jgi:NAD(P)H-nitrite reductase large subunit
MNKDIPEKGAIVQRDGKTFAIKPHIPGGIIQPEKLITIANVAKKYGLVLKITSAQRIAIVGIQEKDIDNIWNELDMKRAAIGPRVRSIKICIGTTFCKKGQQDSVGIGLKLDQKYHGMELPSKLKMGVSGCMNSCSEPVTKDIGIMGTSKGFRIYAGGCSGLIPRLGDLIAEELSEDETLELVDRIINFYKRKNQKKRLGNIIDEIGLDVFKSEIRKEGK